MMSMNDSATKTLDCGCEVRPYRDFLQRVVGTVMTQGAQCARPEHETGKTIIMPGRDNARPE
jgi:hypothetical protein